MQDLFLMTVRCIPALPCCKRHFHCLQCTRHHRTLQQPGCTWPFGASFFGAAKPAVYRCKWGISQHHMCDNFMFLGFERYCIWMSPSIHLRTLCFSRSSTTWISWRNSEGDFEYDCSICPSPKRFLERWWKIARIYWFHRLQKYAPLYSKLWMYMRQQQRNRANECAKP